MSPLDPTNSHPTGVGVDAIGNIYVAEDLPGQSEIRVFTSSGSLIRTITHSSIVAPKGLSVDRQTGDIFVSVQHSILKFTNAGSLLGSYTVGNPNFAPTDVAIWRQQGYASIPPGSSTYQIFATDEYSSQVYAFDVSSNLGTGTYLRVFGSGYLNAPKGLTVDDADAVWVASTGNNRIYAFSPLGTLVRFDTRDFLVEDPTKQFRDVVNLPFDGVYAIDGTSGSGALLLYSYEGNVIGTYGVPDLQCPVALNIHFQVNEHNLYPIADPITPQSSGGGIPAVSLWGGIIFGLLIFTTGWFFIRRRRGLLLRM
jgi:sugar lactone lactonase YvrE